MTDNLSSGEILQRRWANIRAWLANAAGKIMDTVPPDRRATAAPHSQLMNLYREYLEVNELELALDALLQAGTVAGMEGEFWLCLSLAARCLKLDSRQEETLLRYQQGTADAETLQAIVNSTLAELRQPRLGVTEQFLQVHQIAEEPILHTHFDGAKGHAFIKVQGEPYYWVVQSEATAAGAWQAVWGYCSHHANVYLKISHDQLSAEVITQYLGNDPDKSAVKGEPIRPRLSRRFDSHRWYLYSPAAMCRDFENRLNGLLVAIEPIADRLQILQQSGDCWIGISAALYDAVEWPYGFGLNSTVIRQLANAGLCLGFDNYHSGPWLPSEDEDSHEPD